jgi:hypothetical protein
MDKKNLTEKDYEYLYYKYKSKYHLELNKHLNNDQTGGVVWTAGKYLIIIPRMNDINDFEYLIKHSYIIKNSHIQLYAYFNPSKDIEKYTSTFFYTNNLVGTRSKIYSNKNPKKLINSEIINMRTIASSMEEIPDWYKKTGYTDVVEIDNTNTNSNIYIKDCIIETYKFINSNDIYSDIKSCTIYYGIVVDVNIMTNTSSRLHSIVKITKDDINRVLTDEIVKRLV